MHIDRWRLAILLSFLLLALTGPSSAAQQNTAEASKTLAPAATGPSAPSGIPLEEVATEAARLGDLLRGFATNLAPSNEIETIQKFLPQVSADIALELKSTTNILKHSPRLIRSRRRKRFGRRDVRS